MQHVCTICNKSLSRKFSLKQHISTVHNKHRWFHCSLCPKQFVYGSKPKTSCKNYTRKKKLFRIINNDNSRCKRFKYCDNRLRSESTQHQKVLLPWHGTKWFLMVY